MLITDIRVKLVPDGMVLAYVTITFDDQFVVHDIRIIKKDDSYFVAMPEKERRYPCPSCKKRNLHQQKFCGFCATPLPDPDPTIMRFLDIAHPIDNNYRKQISEKIIATYESLVK